MTNPVESPTAPIAVPTEMLRALSVIAKTPPTRTTVPILSHILFTGDGAHMTARATDLEISSSYTCAYSGEPFAATLPAKEIAAFVKGQSDLTMRPDGLRTLWTVYAGASRTFFAYPADEFPPAPIIGEPVASYSAEGRWMVESYLRASTAASREEAHGAVLMGTYVEFGGHPMTIGEKCARTIFTSTDGFRLVSVTTEAGLGSAHIIAPSQFAHALKSLGKLPKGAGGTLSAHKVAGREYIAFACGGYEVISRTIDGQYPNYRQVVPTIGGGDRTGIHAPTFAKAVAAATQAAFANMVKFEFDSAHGRVTVSAQSDTAGDFVTNVPVEAYGHGLDVTSGFNGKFLGSLLALYDGEVIFEQHGPLQPAAIYDVLHDTVAVIMPIRL